jgi:hydrogenase expression/formation protein HypE
MTYVPVGKLPSTLLAELIGRFVGTDPRVLVGPGVGEDAAVIDMGERCLVAKTDPVTFASDDIGWYAVHVNANDVACCGAAPRWFLATLLLPEGETTAELARSIFAQIDRACRELGIALCGGHTEITYGLERPIVVGQMLGEVARDAWVRTAGARVGDAIILTKGIAVEGTAVIAREKRSALEHAVPAETLERAADYLYAPGISVVRDASIALDVGGVHALHDPTEGGVATGLWELAQAAQVGLRIDEERLQVLPECALLCRHLGLNPLGLIGSGALIIAAAEASASAIVERLNAEGVAAAVIGQVVAAERGCQLRGVDGKLRALPTFARDEVARLFA